MAFATNQEARIYYELVGEGPPLTMVLGLGTCIEMWKRTGVVDDLIDRYSLIMIDVRGNGRSYRPYDPAAYRPEAMVGDVLAVLDDLGVKQTNYWGYSIGARLGYQALTLAPWRFSSMILGGASPFAMRSKAEREGEKSLLDLVDMVARIGIEAYAKLVEQASGPMEPIDRALFLANDPKAMYAMMHGVTVWPATNYALPLISVPCLIYAAERDWICEAAREAAAEISDGSFVMAAGAHHFDIQKDDIISDVQRFLEKVTANNLHEECICDQAKTA